MEVQNAQSFDNQVFLQALQNENISAEVVYANASSVILSDQCQPGTYSFNSSCVPCIAGTYSTVVGAGNDSTCTPCGTGLYSTIVGKGDSVCDSCWPGTYGGTLGATACTLCALGTYTATSDKHACDLCTVNMYADVEGLSACKACPDANGITLDVGSTALSQCVCNAHYYGNSSQCVLCPANSDSVVNSPTIASCACNAGFEGDSGVCTACSAGTYNVNNSCVACPAGSYSTALAADSSAMCNLCGAGKYSTGQGAVSSSVCTSCVAGYYATGLGSQECSGCASGTFATASGAIASSVCTNCSAGAYTSALGATACAMCPMSTYSGTVGASSDATCLPCFATSYTTAVGQTHVDACKCPAGRYRDANSGTVQVFPLGYYAFGTTHQLDDSAGGIGALTASGSVSFSDSCAPSNLPCVQLTASANLAIPGFTLVAPAFSVCVDFAYSAFTTSGVVFEFSNGLQANNVVLRRANSQLQYAVYGDGSWATVEFGSLALNTRYHVCVAYQDAVSTVFLNGVSAATLSKTFSFVTRSNNHIGNDFLLAVDSNFDGAIFKFIVAPTMLCAAQVNALYHNLAIVDYTSNPMALNFTCPSLYTCSPCSAGRYATATGATNSAICAQCVAGAYVSSTAATVCATCGVGTYSTALGAKQETECQACDYGRFSTAIAASSSTTCALCGVGTFANVTGSYTCKQCHPDATTTAIGSTSASQCFCKASNYGDGMHCSACVSGATAPAGSDNVLSCKCNLDYYRSPTQAVQLTYTAPVFYYIENNNGLRSFLLETQQCGNIGTVTTPFGPVFGMGIVNSTLYYGGQSRVEVARVDLQTQVQTVQNLAETSRWLFPHVNGNLYYASTTNYIKRVAANAASYATPVTVSAVTGTVQSFVVSLNGSVAFVFEAAYLYKHLLVATPSKSTLVGTGSATPTVNYFSQVSGLSFGVGAQVYGAALSPDESLLYYVATTSSASASYLVRTDTRNGLTITLKNVGATTVYGVILYNDIVYYTSSSASLYYYDLMANDANPSLPNTNTLGSCGGVNVFWGLALATPTTQNKDSFQCTACKTCDINALKLDQCHGNLSYDTSSCLCNANYYGNGTKCNACTSCSANSTVFATCPVNTTVDTTNCTCNANFYGTGSVCNVCPINSSSLFASVNESQCICQSEYYKIYLDVSTDDNVYFQNSNTMISKVNAKTKVCTNVATVSNIMSTWYTTKTGFSADNKILYSYYGTTVTQYNMISQVSSVTVTLPYSIISMYAHRSDSVYFVLAVGASKNIYKKPPTVAWDFANFQLKNTGVHTQTMGFVVSETENYAYVLTGGNFIPCILYKHEIGSSNAGVQLAGTSSVGCTMSPSYTEINGLSYNLGCSFPSAVLVENDKYLYVITENQGQMSFLTRMDTTSGRCLSIVTVGAVSSTSLAYTNGVFYMTTYSGNNILYYNAAVSSNIQSSSTCPTTGIKRALAVPWTTPAAASKCTSCKTCDVNAMRTGTCTPTSDNYNCTCNAGYYGTGLNCSLCTAGSYCVNGVRTTCPANSNSVSGASVCVCNARYYGDFTACTPCSLNMYCIGGNQFPCPMNTVSNGGTASCVCAGGYEGLNQDSCVACNVGKYSFANTSCTNCSQGFYANTTASSSCVVCPLGYYNVIDGMTECFVCSANYWCASGTENACPLHSHSDPGSTSQHACLCDAGYAGDGSLVGTSPCALCFANYYCPGGNNNLSFACGVHRHSAPGSASSLDCICNEGFVEIDGVCTCPAGSYCPSESALPCPANSSSPAGSTSESECTCDPGFHGLATEGCLACGLGFFCPGDTLAVPCTANATTAGYYSVFASECFCDRGFLGTNNTPCVPCPANSWCWTGVANDCPSHTQAPMYAHYMENCTCVPGYYGVDGGPCSICDVGLYCPGGNTTNQCPAYSSSSPGSVLVSDCACFNGFVFDNNLCYCNPGTKLIGSECVPCGADVYCYHDMETACPVHSTAPALSSLVVQCACDPGYARIDDTCVACPAGTYELNDVCVSCPVGTYSEGERNAVCAACDTNGNTTGEGSDSAANCTCNTGWYGNGLVCIPCQVCSPVATLITACDRLALQETTHCTCQDGYAGTGFECTACELGHACTNNEDTPCPIGYYTDEYNISACKACPLGTYGNESTATACHTCFAGTKTNVSDGSGGLLEIFTTSQVASTSVRNCSCGIQILQDDGTCADNCTWGTYWDPVARVCVGCPQGSYCVDLVQTACPMFFSSLPNSSACSPCIGSGSHSDVMLATCGLLTCPAQPLVYVRSDVGAVGLVAVANDLITMNLDPVNDRPVAKVVFHVNVSRNNFVRFEVKGTGNLTFGYDAVTLDSRVITSPTEWVGLEAKFSVNADTADLWVRVESPVSANTLYVRNVELLHLQLWDPVSALTLTTLDTQYVLQGEIRLNATLIVGESYELAYDGDEAQVIVAEFTNFGTWDPMTLKRNGSHTSWTFTVYETAVTLLLRAPNATVISSPELKYKDQPCKTCLLNNKCVADALIACPVHTYAPPGSDVCLCDDGYYGAECATCLPNHFCLNGTITPCAFGFKSDAAASVCTPCVAGEYCKDGERSTCEANAAPLGWPSLSVHNCTCDPGYYGDAAVCAQCDKGSYCLGGTTPTQCAAGTYSAVVGASVASTCTDCGPGYYALAGSSQCMPCVAGSFSPFSKLTSADQCQTCMVGAYCAGANHIVYCDKGTFSNDVGLVSQAQCTICPAGYFCEGGFSRELCPLGSFSPNTNISDLNGCNMCPAGFYCPGPLIKNQCPVNTHSSAGSHDLASCVCLDGFQCRFQNVVHAEVRLPVTVEGFEAIRDKYIAAVAAAAGVPVDNVVIVSVTSQGAGTRRRRLHGNSAYVEVHVSIKPHGSAVQAFERISHLDKYLKPHGLYSMDRNVKIHKEVVESVKV